MLVAALLKHFLFLLEYTSLAQIENHSNALVQNYVIPKATHIVSVWPLFANHYLVNVFFLKCRYTNDISAHSCVISHLFICLFYHRLLLKSLNTMSNTTFNSFYTVVIKIRTSNVINKNIITYYS